MLKLEDMLASARSVVEQIDWAKAQRLMEENNALLLDVREAPELEREGRAVGAHHVPRGMLEFRADPNSPLHDPAFSFDRAIILFCAGGWRSVLAGKLLQDMGFLNIYDLGAFEKMITSEGNTNLAEPGATENADTKNPL